MIKHCKKTLQKKLKKYQSLLFIYHKSLMTFYFLFDALSYS